MIEKNYERYCKKLKVKSQDLYSVHYDWVVCKYFEKTALTFEEYEKAEKKKNLEKALINVSVKRKELDNEEANLIIKLANL